MIDVLSPVQLTPNQSGLHAVDALEQFDQPDWFLRMALEAVQ